MISVRRLMSKNLIKVSTHTTVQDVAQLMADKRIGSVLVEDKGEIVGIATETDIVRKVVAKGVDASSFLVKGIMSTPIFTIDVDRSIFEAGELMNEKKVRHLVVTEGGEVVGVLSIRDIIHPHYTLEESW